MDNKITKRRLLNMLAYDWLKIIIMIVAIVFVWVLAFTMGAPRASIGQNFGVFYYGEFAYTMPSAVVQHEAKKAGVFSYDVLDFNSRDIDLNYYGTIMSAVSATYEGDVMITVDSADKIEGGSSEFRTFIDGYGNTVYDYDSLIEDAKNYCLTNNFVILDGDGNYSLSEENITKYFAKRMQKDPRFRKTDSDRYAQGIVDEIARIKNVWNNAIMLEDCLKNHPELRYNYKRFTQAIKNDPDHYSDEIYHQVEELTYGLNLGALTGGSVEISTEYSKPIYDEKGELVSSSANGIVVCVFDYQKHQPDLQYESLGFVNFLIARYSNFLNANAVGVIA